MTSSTQDAQSVDSIRREFEKWARDCREFFRQNRIDDPQIRLKLADWFRFMSQELRNDDQIESTEGATPSPSQEQLTCVFCLKSIKGRFGMFEHCDHYFCEPCLAACPDKRRHCPSCHKRSLRKIFRQVPLEGKEKKAEFDLMLCSCVPKGARGSQARADQEISPAMMTPQETPVSTPVPIDSDWIVGGTDLHVFEYGRSNQLNFTWSLIGNAQVDFDNLRCKLREAANGAKFRISQRVDPAASSWSLFGRLRVVDNVNHWVWISVPSDEVDFLEPIQKHLDDY